MNSLLANLLSVNCIEHLVINQDCQILEMSAQVKSFADIPNEVKLGNDIRIAFPELIGVEDILDAIIQGEQNNFQLKGINRFQDNCCLYVDMYITKNIKDNEQDNTLIIILMDATERMVLEQSLVQSANETKILLRTLTASNQYIQQVVTSMADALLVTTLSGKIKKSNLAAQALLEYQEAELQGQFISSVIKGIDNDRLKVDETASHTNDLMFSVPLFKEIESVCKSKTGKIIPVAISCSLVQTEVEHFQGYVYILRDMTERKQVELAKQEFLAMINHEIRTPITSVSGMASLLLNTQLTPEQKEFAETIYISSKSLTKIINDILDLSKVESGKLELENQPFELRRCINEALYLLAPKARENKLKLSFIDTPEIPNIIVGDITRLQQILVNLINNAIKFTHNGSVEISLHRTINSGNGENNHLIQFAVKDTGIGIPNANRDRLFKAFSQVNSSITRQYGGTGLGLAICKQLCESMGGTIWVESEVGVGSTFYFTITASVIDEKAVNGAYKREVLTADVEINIHLAQQHPLKILLVEDHVINQRIIRLMLQRMGYEAEVANNGKEALAALRLQAYDVVLMDVQMPEMDGLTATAHIYEEWTEDNRPRIIALTASGMSGCRDRSIAAGVDDYLTKPLQIGDLMQALKKCQPLRGEKKKGKQENAISNSSPIDLTALLEIKKMAEFNPAVNPRQFMLEMIDCYLEDAAKTMIDIHSAFLQANLKTLHRLVHTFFSTSATLGAINLASTCKELETMIATGVTEGVAEKISQMETQYQEAEAALQQEREKFVAQY